MKYAIITILLIITIALLLSCDLEAPTPVRDNPNDGRNPNAIPEIVSVTIGQGNGYATNPVKIELETKATSEIRVNFVQAVGDDLIADWQALDSLSSLPISGADGEKWLAYQAKALNCTVTRDS